MKCKRIGIIGHFGGKENFTDGQTVKTKEIYNYLVEHTSYQIYKVDTYKMKSLFLKKVTEIYKLFNKVDVVILIVSSRGYKILLPIINFFNKQKKLYLYDFVIGGNRQNLFKRHKYLLKIAKKYKKIYVETKEMLIEYQKYGFENVEIMSNFKNIPSFPPKKYVKNIKVFKLCTFSRICKEKGITDAIEVVSKLNSKDKNHKYTLDIYGNIDKSYGDEFKKLLSGNNEYISYCGIVPFSESSKIISSYDILLFLTFWPGEGFPGTLIDSFFASTPVIASDWNYNFEILNENITGIKVKVNDVDGVIDTIINLTKDVKLIEKLSLNCYNERTKYMPETVIKPFIVDLEGNNEK